MENLCVKVVRARNLAARDGGGTSAPYVKVAVEGSHAKTQVIPNDLNPEWNRVFVFSKDKLHGSGFLEISVWDADTAGADDFLGALSFLVEEIPSRKPTESPYSPLWYKLEERPGETRVKGELLMGIWMGNRPDVQEAWQFDTAENSHFHPKLYLQPKMWYLRAHIIEGDLSADNGRPVNPFVEIQLGRNQTKRIHVSTAKGTNPVWNKDVMFVTAEPFEELLVIVVKDRLSPNEEEVIGVVRISLGSVPRRLDYRREVNSSWFVMDNPMGSREVSAGRIHLKLCFEGGYHVFDESPDFSSCTKPTAKQLWKPSLGVLELGIIGAHNLLPMHRQELIGTTNAYCVAKYGQKWIRTRTINENLDPKWNERHTWEVYDPSTVLTVCVIDDRAVSRTLPGVKDTPIGKVYIRLSTLKSNRVYTNSHPLLVVTASGIKKMGELECSVRFSCASTIKLMEAYLQPPLPAMHYSTPIDPLDFENLLTGAMDLVASGLARFEPPLRREVVQFALDTRSNRWSMRRTKANYYRIAGVLSSLFGFHVWVDDIRTWKYPERTVLVHIVFLILVWYPELLLPTAFFYMCAIGAWNYRFRSTMPPFMDVQLSQGGEEPITDLDELEEEFNVTTSTGNEIEQVLKARYTRLRGYAGRIQNFMGNVATQGERLQSLLSWRDPMLVSMQLCAPCFVIFVQTPSFHDIYGTSIYTEPLCSTMCMDTYWKFLHSTDLLRFGINTGRHQYFLHSA